MNHTADIQQLEPRSILEVLRNQALSMPVSSTSVRYLRALDSLESSVFSFQSSECGQTPRNTARSADTEPTAPILRAPLADWLVNLWLNSTPFATASLYLDIISSLYGSAVKAGLLPPTKIFSQIKIDLKALGPDGWKKGIDDEIFTRALRLTKNAAHLVADDAVAASMVIWSLTHSLIPLTDIALLKKSDLCENRGSCVSKSSEDSRLRTEDLNIISLIVNRSSLKRSSYLFPLRQSQRTPKQLSNHINKIINALFRRARLPQAENAFDTVESLWAYAALRSGVPAGALVSYLGHAPLGLPVLKLSSSSSLSSTSSRICENAENTENAENEKNTARSANTFFKEDFSQVGKIFLENPPRWYAMALRPGVRFTQVCRRLQLLLKTEDSRLKTLADVSLFYPCEEISRAIGKKIVTRQRPFIHSAVFFRAKLTDIGTLFSRIGDLAWCYRQSSRPGAPYADISQRQFELFQRTIARFTPDYEVAPIGELELKKNDRVQIVGGLFTGMGATFDSAIKEEEGTVYRLNIVGDNGIEWRIEIDHRLASPSN